MERKYKKILFDLDNTLVDDDKNREYAIEQILIDRKEKYSIEQIEHFLELDNKFWKYRAEGKIKDPYKFENNEEKTKWIRAQRFMEYFKNISFEEGVEINKKYIDYLEKKIIPIKNAKEILGYLYEKQYEIYIVTNGPLKVVNEKLSKINAQKYIKDVFTAEEVGHMKPHREFFDKAFEKMNCYNTKEMLIIGDELEKDVLGGIQNEIDSCWFNRKSIVNNTNIKPNYEINNLIDLKSIL